MYLKKLILDNFQAHEHLEIEFVNGVNTICGESGVGKSCIKHAIEFVCQHDTFNGQRKVGTKKTSVLAEFDNGTIVERIVSASINRYILTVDGDKQQFDAVGKTAPIEIQEAIGILPLEIDGEKIYLNSQSQIALPFLFDKSPSFRMKLFNKLTGNDVLDKLFGKFNKDILRIKRGYKEETATFEKRAEELEIKEVEKEKAEAIHIRLKKRVNDVKKKYEKYAKLVELKELSVTNSVSINEAIKALNCIKIPELSDVKGLIEKINRLSALSDLKNYAEKLSVDLGRVSGQLKEIKPLSVDISALTTKISRLDTLKRLSTELDNKEKMWYTIQREVKVCEKELSVSVNNRERLIAEIDFCPFCKREMTEDCKKELQK